MKKVKVLHIHTLPVISGSGINTFLSMSGLDLSRYEPELACAPGGRLIDLVESSGFKARRIKNFRRPLSPIRDIMAVFELIFLLKKEKYDIVHTHNSKAGFIGRLAAKLAGVPVVVHTVHGFAFHAYEGFWRRKTFIFLERLAARWCDGMIAISAALVDWAKREKIACRGEIVKIYSGIETDKFFSLSENKTKRAGLGIKDEDLVLGEVAKLWDGKGQEIILRILPGLLREIPSLKVVFVGEGELESGLKKLAGELKVEDNVIFTGFRSDIAELTSIFDIACLPSLWEGMGRSVLEAMACGKPVVASRVGGIVDLVEDGVTGFLVPPADAKALAGAIIKLLKDKQLREKMGQEARRIIDEKFSARTMARRIQDVYEELLKRKGWRG